MTTLENTWFLQFANESANEEKGRPWGDGTAIAARNILNTLPPWDEGCRVTSLFGGYAAMKLMGEKLKAAIEGAIKQGKPFGQRGHVYFADWRFNPLRDISDSNVPYQPGNGTDPTILGLILRLMQAGIQVRALFWMPTKVEGEMFAGYGPHIEEHFWMARIVESENARLVRDEKLTSELGIVGLDMRLPDFFPQAASHHQKMMVIRAGGVDVAFCGGVDLAFTRRDTPRANFPSHPVPPKFMDGDWQSGDLIPVSNQDWPRQQDIIYLSVDSVARPKVQWSTDLPIKIYGSAWQIWHDQHLLLEGPIVATLEHQFNERWIDSGSAFSLNEWLPNPHWFVGQVIFSSEKAFHQPTRGILDLETAQPIEPLPGASAKVQMWRTVPLRRGRTRDPFKRGEYTIMAGVAKATKAARELIWIFDQYFWSRELARLINRQLKSLDPERSGLHILIILPPHADGVIAHTHHARRLAIAEMVNGLNAAQLQRVGVFDLWKPGGPAEDPKGIYCHAKAQTYDGSLLVCGSANLNRRSLSCDTELDCAVLDASTVASHQRGLWELLFPSVAWPNLDLNTKGNGAMFFSQFMQAKEASGSFLIPDPWLPNQSRVLPTNPPTQLESDPVGWWFDLLYANVLDPTSFKHAPAADEDLDRWSYLIESPGSREHWRTTR